MSKKSLLVLMTIILTSYHAFSQEVLSLKKAIDLTVKNYGTIRAKKHYSEASSELVKQAKKAYLPDVRLGARNDYGTINGLYGPSYGFGGSGLASSGPYLSEESWNAAFGSLYFTSVNWDVFSFGKAKQNIKVAEAAAEINQRDFEQEVFQYKVKVAAAYLNLLAAQQLESSYQKNLERAETFKQIATTRAYNCLIAGVDSLQANAAFSSAKIALTQAIVNKEEQANQLAILLSLPHQEFILDSVFVSKIPLLLQDSVSTKNHPVLQWYQSRIKYSESQENFIKASYFPTVSLVGVIQTRGSGFGPNYASEQLDYSSAYWDGVQPSRGNYLLGVGLFWNLAQPFKLSNQFKAQKLTSTGLQEEYNLASQQIEAQLALSDIKIKNALDNFREAPIQVDAAHEAYLRQSKLYENGLTDLNTVTQALYALVRAETDRDIANNNVWQALLLKAAATGNFNLFEDQL